MSVSGFSLEYSPVCQARPEFGTAAVIPWDTNIFGFPIADYRLGVPEEIAAAEAKFRTSLISWVDARSVRMMSCSSPTRNLFAMPALARTGFSFIELGIRASLTNLQKRFAQAFSGALRLAVPPDFPAIESIAATAFRAGRYAADPLISAQAAAQRYVFWIGRALSGVDPKDRMFVMGDVGHPTCFFHLCMDGDIAHLRLAAVRSDLQGGALGYRLYGATLQKLQEEGTRGAMARFSATNTPVLNLYSSFGFSFSSPEIVLHWHVDSAL
jgi:ribosomal protein S18 acetylase RimI-like enzyme